MPRKFGMGAARAYSRMTPGRRLAQAGPIVGDEDRVGGIGGVVLDAGGLAGSEALEMNVLFESGDVLRGFVSNAGNQVGIADQLAAAPAFWRKLFARLAAGGRGLGRGVVAFNDLHNLALTDTPHLIQIGAALALDLVGIGGPPGNPVNNRGERCQD